MRRGLSLFGICAILFTSAIAPTPADAFGGARGGGGFAFNPGGFQGFNPGGFQGFNPADARPAIPLRPPKPRRVFPNRPGWGAATRSADTVDTADTGYRSTTRQCPGTRSPIPRSTRPTPRCTFLM